VSASAMDFRLTLAATVAAAAAAGIDEDDEDEEEEGEEEEDKEEDEEVESEEDEPATAAEAAEPVTWEQARRAFNNKDMKLLDHYFNGDGHLGVRGSTATPQEQLSDDEQGLEAWARREGDIFEAAGVPEVRGSTVTIFPATPLDVLETPYHVLCDVGGAEMRIFTVAPTTKVTALKKMILANTYADGQHIHGAVPSFPVRPSIHGSSSSSSARPSASERVVTLSFRGYTLNNPLRQLKTEGIVSGSKLVATFTRG
jgi:hypothetical protein